MHVLQLHHVEISMPPDRELEARLFYEKLLGIPEVPKPPRLASRGGCWFERGTLKVHLGVEKGFSPARKAHPAFLVDDLAAVIELLKQNGMSPGRTNPSMAVCACT